MLRHRERAGGRASPPSASRLRQEDHCLFHRTGYWLLAEEGILEPSHPKPGMLDTKLVAAQLIASETRGPCR
jgi:hypothetical protein